MCASTSATTNSDQKIVDSQNEQLVETKGEERTSLKTLLSSAIGMDLSSIAVPVTYNEPLSFLQRMFEYIYYHDLLDKAAFCDDPILRILYVTVFTITRFASTERKVKPFNPLLGETFEYVNNEKQLRFVAEQVSHHPPVGAAYCDAPGWVYQQSQAVKTKFLGNSLDVTPTGISHVTLTRYNERYSWHNVHTVVHNLVIGRMWIDHFGQCPITLQNTTTNEIIPLLAEVTYKECGWFGRGWHDIEGQVTDGTTPFFTLTGKWNEQVIATPTGAIDNRIDKTNPLYFDQPNVIWKHTQAITSNPSFSKYEWYDSTIEAVILNDQIRKEIMLTDSRLREDRLHLMDGHVWKASTAKNELEQLQRVRREHRANNQISWNPRHFKRIDDDTNQTKQSEEQWVFSGNYWQEREARISSSCQFASNEDANKLWRSTQDW